MDGVGYDRGWSLAQAFAKRKDKKISYAISEGICSDGHTIGEVIATNSAA